MTAFAFAVAMADLGVNGPEDDRLDWDAVDWRAHEDNVRRLRQRIFKATQDGDLPKVRNLQKLMLRSRPTRWSACGRPRSATLGARRRASTGRSH